MSFKAWKREVARVLGRSYNLTPGRIDQLPNARFRALHRQGWNPTPAAGELYQGLPEAQLRTNF